MSDEKKDALVFEVKARGYTVRAWYLKEPKEDALCEISKDGEVVKSLRWPAYKVWNLAAHADDIAEGLERKSDGGLFEAGSTGLGGTSIGRSPPHDRTAGGTRGAGNRGEV